MENDFFFKDEATKVPHLEVYFIETTRLVKMISKKTGEFKAWKIQVKKSIDKIKTNPKDLEIYDKIIILIAESGVYDYTENGDFFGLTPELRSRALIKKTNIYG